MKNNHKQKAALFGLDIRLALLIFTSLALITTASVFRIIKQSKSVHLLSDIKSIEIAYKNFGFDTHYHLSEYSNPYFYNIAELVSLTKDPSKPYTVKYKGPYIDYKQGATDNFIVHPVLNKNVALVSRSFSNFAASDKLSKCSESDCMVWVVIYDIDQSLAEGLDFEVDFDIDHSAGKLRLEPNGSNFDVYYPISKEK